MRLIYHGGGVITNFPIFFRGGAFFKQFTLYPGGLIEYTGAFLAQFFYYSWAGAIVVTLLAWSICFCIDCLLTTFDVRRAAVRGLRFVPAILLLAVYSRYTYHFTSVLVVPAALLPACLYLRATAKPGLSHAFFFIVLSAILYYIVGAGYLLFAAVCVICELLLRRRPLMGILCLLCALLIPYVEGVLIFETSIINAYTELLPISWRTATHTIQAETVEMVYAIYLLAPLVLLGLGLWRRFGTPSCDDTEHSGGKAKTSRKKRPGPVMRIRLFWAARPVFRWSIESLAVLAVAIGVAIACYDDKRKAEFEVAYYSSAKMWPQLLKSASRHPGNHRISNAVNRALYHTGRLGYDMFAYPQHPESFLLTAEKYKVAYWDRFDTRIELGLVDMAVHDLTECIGMFGRRPAVLKGLALANMVKGDIGSARIYLGALAKTLFESAWADRYLDILKSDPNLSNEKEIQRLRGLRVEKDHGSVLVNNEIAMLALLDSNNKNRMAFEYLMSWYLLTKQSAKIAAQVRRLNELGYSEVPRLYEEALFVYAYRTGKSVELDGSWGRPKSGPRIEDFSRIYKSYGRDKEAAFPELAAKYGDSYFFYDLYGFSGVKN